VMTVYAAEPNAFDGTEQAVPTELGEMIAHTIDGIETRRALRTENTVELTLRIENAETPLSRLSERAGCEIEFDGRVPRNDATQLFFTARDASADEIRATGEQLADLTEMELIADREDGTAAGSGATREDSTAAADDRESDCLFEATATGSTLASVLVEENAVVRSLTTTGSETTAVIDLPSTADVSEFVETVRDASSRAELVARRTRERPIKTQGKFLASFEDRLSDRQRNALRTAYLSGFFQSPRDRTGAELAETLGVSQPTFAHHLREAERKLCAMVFDETDP